MGDLLLFVFVALAIAGLLIWVYVNSQVRAATDAKNETANVVRVAGQRIAEWKAALEAAKKEATAAQDEANRQLSAVRAKLAATNDELSTARSQAEVARADLKRVREVCQPAINTIRTDGVLLPSLVAWADLLQRLIDDGYVALMRSGPRPANVAADRVREARALAREATKRARLLEHRVILYEALAPWLLEHTDCTVEELLAGLREEEALHESHERGEDPGSTYLTAAEWKELSEDERNQLALDRYWLPSRRRSPWTAGIEYERFVGYSYEQAGFAVTYHGATLKKDDLGIDLVCKKAGILHLVQCKRLSVQKGLPVRENVIAQTYGAAMFYALRAGLPAKSVVPAIVTTFELSETARKFAEHLGVSVRERFAFAPYPCIKCNITKDGGRIYHLPFDQQYDATAIDRDGEFYAATVAEARKRGFRRAFKWRGGAG